MRARVSAVAALSLALLSPLTISPAQAAVSSGVGVVTDSLLMYYDAANYSGLSGTTLKDLSGNGYDATLVQSSGKPSLNTGNGNYLEFNASGGYVDIPDISSSSAWDGLTISFYANFGNTRENYERILDFGKGQMNENILISRIAGQNDIYIEVFHGSNSGGVCQALGSLVTNEWAHWTFTIGGGNCYVHKNNIQIATMGYSYLPRAQTLTANYLAKSNWCCVDVPFEGGIADIAIYKKALNSTERLQNFNAQTDITAPTYTGAASFSVNENQTVVSALSASEFVTIIPLAGSMDTNKFSISSTTLSFITAPNFEAKGSTGGGNQYLFYFRLMDLNGNVSASAYAPSINVQDLVESTSLTVPTLSATPYKGVALTLTVTPSGDGTSIPGKVTYLIGGKRIPGCYKKSYSGTGNSICTFEPSIRGHQEISVTYTPANTSFTVASSKKSFFIYNRTTKR